VYVVYRTKSFCATAAARPGQRLQYQSHGAQHPEDAAQRLSVQQEQARYQSAKPNCYAEDLCGAAHFHPRVDLRNG
jgi:hypothetical protein